MLLVDAIMTRDVVTVAPELSLREAMELFVARHVSGAPVVEGRRVVGVVTVTDLLAIAASLPGAPTERPPAPSPGEDVEPEPFLEGEEAPGAFFAEYWDDAGVDTAERIATPDSPEWNALAEHVVREAMTDTVLALPPGTSVLAAADFMQQHEVHRVLVMQGEALLGIVTTSDVARAVAEHRLGERRFVFGPPKVAEDGSWW